MTIGINNTPMVSAASPSTKLFHLSYDRLNDYDNTKLKKEIVWEILINQQQKYYLDSPCGTTIIFESRSSFVWWLKKLEDCFRNKMCFQLSEVVSDIVEGERFFHANSNPCETDFITTILAPVANDILNTTNPTTKCP